MDEAAEIEGAPEGGSRRRGRHLRVPVTAEEVQHIDDLAQQTGLSIAAYLRLVGLGYKPRNVVDFDEVQRLVAVNGDLGRMGGLLKLWLTDDAKLDEFKPEEMRRIVRGLLKKIEAGQEELREVAKSVLIARP